MYLDPWMIVTLIISFGICAVYNRRRGFYNGGVRTLEALEQRKIIRISDEGEILKG